MTTCCSLCGGKRSPKASKCAACLYNIPELRRPRGQVKSFPPGYLMDNLSKILATKKKRDKRAPKRIVKRHVCLVCRSPIEECAGHNFVPRRNPWSQSPLRDKFSLSKSKPL